MTGPEAETFGSTGGYLKLPFHLHPAPLDLTNSVRTTGGKEQALPLGQAILKGNSPRGPGASAPIPWRPAGLHREMFGGSSTSSLPRNESLTSLKARSSHQASSSSLEDRELLPAHNPYADGWLLRPPLGRWILDRGRPRCIQPEPAEPAGDVPVSGRTLSKPPKGLAQAKPQQGMPSLVPHADAAASAQPTRPSKPQGIKAFVSPTIDGLSSVADHRLRSETEPQPQAPKDASQTRLALSCRKSFLQLPQVKAFRLESNKESCRDSQRMSRRASGLDQGKEGILSRWRKVREAATLIEQVVQQHKADAVPFEVPDIQEILKPLMDVSNFETVETQIPRYDWVGASTANPSLRRTKTRVPGLDNRPSPELTPRKPMWKSQKSFLPGARLHQMQRKVTWGRVLAKMQGAQEGQTPIVPTPSSPSKHDMQDRKIDRDLRTEMKKLRESLHMSAKSAFEPAVWEELGIESEHLKRQNFALLLGRGLVMRLDGAAEEGHEDPESDLGQASDKDEA